MGINSIVGIGSRDETFEDGSKFKIKFTPKDIIKLAKDKPIKGFKTFALRIMLGRDARRH